MSVVPILVNVPQQIVALMSILPIVPQLVVFRPKIVTVILSTFSDLVTKSIQLWIRKFC
jgi:hypothetical protein